MDEDDLEQYLVEFETTDEDAESAIMHFNMMQKSGMLGGLSVAEIFQVGFLTGKTVERLNNAMFVDSDEREGDVTQDEFDSLPFQRLHPRDDDK